jgi:PAS domain S-box-containing protein
VELEKIKVLLVDDDQGDFEMTRALLDSAERRDFEYELDWVSTFEEGLDALNADEYDVYLLDYFLEDRTGLDLLREVGRQQMSAPVIMLTGRGSRQVDMEAMKAGASDYLVKGRIDPELLERAIRYALERVRSQEALRESEERHRSMFDHLPVGLYRTTRQGDFLDANPALIRMLGYPDRNQLQNSFARDLYVSPEDRPEFLDLLERHGLARGFESKIQKLDGETIRVLNTARVHRNADGEVLYMEGSLEDITSLQGAETSHGSEARFRAIFDNAPVPIAMLDLDALVDEANPTFQEVFGAKESQIKGLPYPELLIQDEQSQMLEDLAALSRGNRDEIVGERRYQGPEGAVIWARTTLLLVRDPEGKPDHLLLLLDDLSEGEVG